MVWEPLTEAEMEHTQASLSRLSVHVDDKQGQYSRRMRSSTTVVTDFRTSIP
jgi:hypothetical protein